MYPDRENLGNFSDWQKNRIRGTLFAYYLSKKRRGYSANALAYEICTHPRTNLEIQIDKKYFNSEDFNSDLGLPVRGNNLNKWFNGINDTHGPNNLPLRRFQDPEPQLVLASYVFLEAKGWITPEQMVEPKAWPLADLVASQNNKSLFDEEHKYLLPYFCRDFRLSEPRDFQILSISTERSDDPFKARLIGSIEPLLRKQQSRAKINKSYECWGHLWGWLLPFRKDFAYLILQDLNLELYGRFDLFLIKSQRKSDTSLYASQLDFIVGEETSHERVRKINQALIKEGMDNDKTHPDLRFSILNDLSLINYLKQYNIYFEKYGSSKWLLSDETLEDQDLSLIDESSQLRDAIWHIFNEYRGAMDTSKSEWQKLCELTGIESDEDVMEAIDLNQCSDPVLLGRRLHWGIMHNTAPSEITKLRQSGVDINFRDKLGRTPLHTAAYYTRGDHIRELAKIPDTDFLALTKCGALPSTLHLERPIYQYPAITRYLSALEKRQASESSPEIDYNQLVLKSLNRSRDTLRHEDPFQPDP